VRSSIAPGLLRIGLNIELDLLPFVQLVEGGLLNNATVKKQLIAAVCGLDESKPALTNDAGDASCCHLFPPVGLLMRAKFERPD
jgi:hypothetical protein